MAAGVGDLQHEVGIGFFARLQPIILRLAILADRPAAAVAIEREFGALILRGERARRQHRGFLVARQQQDDRAFRLEALFLELRHRGDHHRYVELIVLRPTAENIAIFLDRHKGVARPILRIGLDDVHMAEQHDRLLLRRPGQRRGEGRGVAHRGDFDIAVGIARSLQHVGIIGREFGHLAAPLDGRNRDAVFQYLPCGVGVGGFGVNGRGGEQGGSEGERGGTVAHEGGLWRVRRRRQASIVVTATGKKTTGRVTARDQKPTPLISSPRT